MGIYKETDDSKVFTLEIRDSLCSLFYLTRYTNLVLLELTSSVVDVGCLHKTRIRCMIMRQCELRGGMYPQSLVSLIVTRCSYFYLDHRLPCLSKCDISYTLIDNSISCLDGSPLRELKIIAVSNFVPLKFVDLRKLGKLELSSHFCQNDCEFLKSTNIYYFAYDKYVFTKQECVKMYIILKKYNYNIDIGDLVFELLAGSITC